MKQMLVGSRRNRLFQARIYKGLNEVAQGLFCVFFDEIKHTLERC